MDHKRRCAILVLARNLDEQIVCTTPDGSRITITLLEIQHNRKARLGIEAPSDVTIHRGEVQAAVDAGIVNPNIAAKIAQAKAQLLNRE